MKAILRSTLSLYLLLFISLSVVAQDYSAFDKARIIKSTDPTIIKKYIDNNYLFNQATIDANLDVATSLSVFRKINYLNNLIDQESPLEKFDYIIENDKKVFDFSTIVKFQFLAPSFKQAFAEIDATKSMSDSTKTVAISLLQSPSPEQTQQVVGSGGTPSGASFATNLIEATANLLLERAKQELANSFYGALQAKLDSIRVLNIMFPNTTEIFVTRDPFTLPSMGTAWKSAFELDLRAIPDHAIDFLIYEVPERKVEWETLGALLAMLESLKDGKHMYEAINILNKDMPQDSDLKQPIKLLQIISEQSLNSGNNSGELVWASLADFRKLGKDGQAMYLGFLMQVIESEGFDVETITLSKLNDLVVDLSNFLSAFEKAQSAIKMAKEKPEQLTEAYNSLTNSTSEMLSALKTAIEDIEIKTVADGPEIVLSDVSAKIETLQKAFNILKKGKQAINAKEYGQLLPILLQLFETIDTKTYDQIQAEIKGFKNDLVRDLNDLNKKDYLDDLIKYVESDTAFAFTGLESIKSIIQDEKVQVLKLISPDAKAGLRASTYNLVVSYLEKLKIHVPIELIRITTFITDVTNAKDKEELQGVLDAAILPVGSYRMKRQPHSKSIFLQGFAGFTGGYELPSQDGANADFSGIQGGLFLPVGFEYVKANLRGGYSGMFISIVDLGAVGKFSLDNEIAMGNNTMTAEMPPLTFSNVLSPGLFYTNGLSNVPITWGMGARYSPELRSIETTDQNGDPVGTPNLVGGFQFNVFLAVDIPLFRVFYKNTN